MKAFVSSHCTPQFSATPNDCPQGFSSLLYARAAIQLRTDKTTRDWSFLGFGETARIQSPACDFKHWTPMCRWFKVASSPEGSVDSEMSLAYKCQWYAIQNHVDVRFVGMKCVNSKVTTAGQMINNSQHIIYIVHFSICTTLWLKSDLGSSWLLWHYIVDYTVLYQIKRTHLIYPASCPIQSQKIESKSTHDECTPSTTRSEDQTLLSKGTPQPEITTLGLSNQHQASPPLPATISHQQLSTITSNAYKVFCHIDH